MLGKETANTALAEAVKNDVQTKDSFARVMDHLKAEWAGVALTVVDASPFPRACTGATGCVDVITR